MPHAEAGSGTCTTRGSENGWVRRGTGREPQPGRERDGSENASLRKGVLVQPRGQGADAAAVKALGEAGRSY